MHRDSTRYRFRFDVDDLFVVNLHLLNDGRAAAADAPIIPQSSLLIFVLSAAYCITLNSNA